MNHVINLLRLYCILEPFSCGDACLSMLWNKEPVTSKRLHKEPREGGHVDLLISELAYMS